MSISQQKSTLERQKGGILRAISKCLLYQSTEIEILSAFTSLEIAFVLRNKISLLHGLYRRHRLNAFERINENGHAIGRERITEYKAFLADISVLVEENLAETPPEQRVASPSGTHNSANTDTMEIEAMQRIKEHERVAAHNEQGNDDLPKGADAAGALATIDGLLLSLHETIEHVPLDTIENLALIDKAVSIMSDAAEVQLASINYPAVQRRLLQTLIAERVRWNELKRQFVDMSVHVEAEVMRHQCARLQSQAKEHEHEEWVANELLYFSVIDLLRKDVTELAAINARAAHAMNEEEYQLFQKIIIIAFDIQIHGENNERLEHLKSCSQDLSQFLDQRAIELDVSMLSLRIGFGVSVARTWMHFRERALHIRKCFDLIGKTQKYLAVCQEPETQQAFRVWDKLENNFIRGDDGVTKSELKQMNATFLSMESFLEKLEQLCAQ